MEAMIRSHLDISPVIIHQSTAAAGRLAWLTPAVL